MLGYLVAAGWSVSLFFAFALGRLDSRAGRHRRRGGYVKLRASTATKSGWDIPQVSAAGLYVGTMPPIRLRGEDFSFSVPPGGVSAAWAIPRWHHDPSRCIGRGWSTGATAARGANGERRVTADSADLGGCLR